MDVAAEKKVGGGAGAERGGVGWGGDGHAVCVRACAHERAYVRARARVATRHDAGVSSAALPRGWRLV